MSVRKLFSTLSLCLATITVMAQNNPQHTVKGQAIDRDSSEPLVMAAVQILSIPDSSQVKGVVTDTFGNFELSGIRTGTYILKISYVGYHDYVSDLEIDNRSSRTIDLEQIKVRPDTKLLDEAVIVAEVPKVQAVKDTLMFNSAAYRVAEGASIQELIKKLPGVEVSSDGTMTVNGKEVTQILINGKEYMSTDLETLLNNLPANMVDRLKTYEKKSDLAKITGIDDGEEQTVFDLQIKKEMMGGLMTNIDLAYGSHDLYDGRVMVNRFTDEDQFQLFANASNVIDQGIGNGGRQWGGNRGLNTRQDLFGTYSHTTEKLEFNSNIGMSHYERDLRTVGSSEYFYGERSTFSNNRNTNISSSTAFRINLYLEWKPDTMTNIILRPNFNTSKSDSYSESESATFNDDPYDVMTDPLAELEDLTSPYDTIRTNHNTGMSNSDSKGTNGSFSLQANRKLNNEGRNITFRANGSYNDNSNHNTSYNTTHYYRLKNAAGLDSINIRNRYTESPSDSYNYSLQLMYSEPVFTNVFWQTSYRFNVSNNRNDRDTYQFDNMAEYGYDQRPADLYNYLDSSLSTYAHYRTYRHDIQSNIRVVREMFNMSVGVRVQPYTTHMDYTKGEHYELTKHMLNVNPMFDFRYNFDETTQFRINYYGNSSQPSMTNLLPITDNSNPLYITMGNPDLKPSYTSNISGEYHAFDTDKQSGFVTRGNFSTTKNSISNRVEYNQENGGSITRPENINGNWNAFYMIGGNFALKDARFTMHTYTNFRYNHYVSYLYQSQYQTSDKNTTKSFSPSENLGASFRDENVEITLQGSVNWSHSRNELNSSNNMDTWNFSYGPSGNVTLPYDFRLYMDLLQSSRRGYSDDTFNTDELIWNVQISKSFLKNKAAMLSLQMFDILGQRKNYSRYVSATSKSDTQYNSINQYFLIHFSYRLNMFNGEMVEEEENDQNNRGGFGGPGRYRR